MIPLDVESHCVGDVDSTRGKCGLFGGWLAKSGLRGGAGRCMSRMEKRRQVVGSGCLSEQAVWLGARRLKKEFGVPIAFE